MSSVATPAQTINKNFLLAVGLWPHQDGFVKYLLLFNMLFFTSSQGYLQIGGMIAAWEDKDVFLESIPPVLVDFVCFAKIINFIANSKRVSLPLFSALDNVRITMMAPIENSWKTSVFQMRNLLVILEEDWKKFKGRGEIEIMNEYAKLGRKLTLSYAACLYGSMTPFMIIPAVPILLDLAGSGNETHVKHLMFRVDFLMDAEKYYYPLLIHSYFGTIAYITTCVAIDTIFMIYVQHACAAFAIMGYRLEHLTDGVDISLDVYPHKDDDLSYHDMAHCIAQHNHALEYSMIIEDANFVSYFFQLGNIMICISFTGFQTVMHLDRPDVAVRYAAFTLTQLFLLFLQSYPAQMLYDHSIQVSDYVHNCGWYQTSIRTRKLVCLMTMRSRVPCVLTAGRFYVLNLANFSAVVRTSMSYLTVLTSMK